MHLGNHYLSPSNADYRRQERISQKKKCSVSDNCFLKIIYFIYSVCFPSYFLYVHVPEMCTAHHPQRPSPKGKWPFSAFVGTIWGIFLSHVPRLQYPCQAVAATAGTGLAGLCNLIISILGSLRKCDPEWKSVKFQTHLNGNHH